MPGMTPYFEPDIFLNPETIDTQNIEMSVLPYPELYKDAPFVVLSDWVSVKQTK